MVRCLHTFLETVDGLSLIHIWDYVYYQGDNLVFSSRIDSQVQVNGIRIELDEVKSIVDKLKSVKSSRVVFYKKKLVVFYEADLNIKEDIIRSLPSYLNPTVVKVESYYLNQNRKLDVPKMLEIYYLSLIHI